jgi:hypothetical protein
MKLLLKAFGLLRCHMGRNAKTKTSHILANNNNGKTMTSKINSQQNISHLQQNNT